MTRRDTFKLSLLAAGQPLGHAETPRGPRQYKWIPKLSENLPDCRIPTLKWLKQLGCEYAQGYFFSKPLPPGDAIKFIAMHFDSRAIRSGVADVAGKS